MSSHNKIRFYNKMKGFIKELCRIIIVQITSIR
nr:MAG TPA: hypothetical protein [Caudoviricetes sp.]